MTSREIVKRAIHFQYPPRIPYNFDSNRTPVDGITYGEDMMWVFAQMRAAADGENEWGVIYEAIGDSFGEPKKFPLEGKEDLICAGDASQRDFPAHDRSVWLHGFYDEYWMQH